MRITKRDGSSQQFLPNKILTRIKNRSQGLKVNAHELFQKVIPSIKDGMTTTDIDELIAFTSADMVTTHPDYSLLGGRLLLSRLSKLIDKPLQPVDETYDFFGAITFLKKYSKKVDGSPSELPSCMYERVAKHLAKDKKEYKLFADELKTKRINCATPIYTNAGIEGRNGMISCNLTHLQEDSIDGIENTLTKIAYASKEGAGIGLMIDNLRSKKSDVTSFSAKAGGIVRFADMVQSKMRFYKQGTRSGSCALYLSVWHRDIMDFLELTLPVGQEELRTRDLFLSVTINDLFMNKLLSNEPWHLFCPKVLKDNGLRPLEDLWGEEFEAEYQKAVDLGIGHEISPKKIWDSIIKSQVESGRPYVFFKDNANRKNMQSNIGVIKQSNLCMTGDQRVVTDKGYLTVKQLHDMGGELNLFNGVELVKSSPMKLRGTQEDVYKITLDNGMEHKVTSYHGIPTIDSNNNVTRVECKDLKVGDKVPVQTKKGLFGSRQLAKEAYLLGLYQSDGTQSESSIMFDLWENDFDLVDVIETHVHDLYDKYGYKPRYSTKGGYFVDSHPTQNGVKKKRLTSSFFKQFGFQKGYVPQWVWEANEETHWAYLKGLLEADGTVYLGSSKGNPIQLSYADTNINFLKELQLIFNNLGLNSKIHSLKEGGKRSLPNGKGDYSDYDCSAVYRLCVTNKNSILEIERNTNFLSRKNVILEDREYRDNSKKGSKVTSVEYVGKEDVYCPTVYNDEHIFIAQGMKTFNCIEIMEASKPSYTPQCTLGSINLSEHESEKTIKHSVKVLTRMLNRVIDKNKWSDDWSKNAGEDQRALAIGVAGMADFFAKKKISFESEEAVEWQHKIFGTMYESAVEESQKMAEEEGVYPAWEGSPYSKGIKYTSKVTGRVLAPSQREPIKVRNSLFLGLMPTASSSILLGVFESFEPVTSNLFTRRVGQGEFTVINKYLVSELDDLNLWNQEMMDKIIANGGSIQNIVEIPEDVRYRYKDVWEISQKTLLDLASVRNYYVDQSQSMNVYHKDAKYSKISSALMYAWKKGLKTGVYYTRTKSKIENNAKLAGVTKEKPKDSQFECFGCSS